MPIKICNTAKIISLNKNMKMRKRKLNFRIQVNTLYTFSSPSGDDNSAFSSCSGVGSASPEISFPKT